MSYIVDLGSVSRFHVTEQVGMLLCQKYSSQMLSSIFGSVVTVSYWLRSVGFGSVLS